MELSEVNESFNTLIALKLISTALCFLILLSTILEVFFNKKSQNNFLLSFSLIKNAKTLFNMKEDKNAITSIHGIRGLCILCIIIQHFAYFRAQSPFVNEKNLMDFALSYVGEAVAKLTGSVDSFLVISGALLTRASFKSLEKGNFRKMKIILQRFLSITPCLGFIMLFDDVITRSSIKSDKDIPMLNQSVKNCWTYWWSVLIHVQNYYNPTKLCMSTSWYLDVDFQMFLVAPFLIYFLWRWKGKFLPLIYGLILTSCLIGFKTTIDYELASRDYHFGNQKTDIPVAYLIYLPTHIRGMPFLVGIVLGYFIYVAENSKNLKHEKSSFLQAIFTIFSLYIFSTPITSLGIDLGYAAIPNALYIGFGRLLWSTATHWMIYSCHIGLNVRINKFLSHRFWIPFGRMGLSVYLVHPVIIRFNVFQEREKVSFEFHPFDLFVEFLSILLFSALFYLFIQEPMTQVTKYVVDKIFKKRNKDKKEK